MSESGMVPQVQEWKQARPVVEIIRQRAILQDFPGRTEADLYLWLCRNRRELEQDYKQHIMMEEAARDLATRHGKSLPGSRHVRAAARWAVGAVRDWTADARRVWHAARRRQ